MKDISTKVDAALEWSAADALRAAEGLKLGLAEGQVEWEEDEAWLALSIGTGPDAEVAGFVHAGLSLVFVSDSLFPADLEIAEEVQLIRFREYAGPPEFSIMPELLGRFGITPESWEHSEVDTNGFNVNDLWFTTVS